MPKYWCEVVTEDHIEGFKFIFEAWDIQDATSKQLAYFRKLNPALIGNVYNESFSQLYFPQNVLGEYCFAMIYPYAPVEVG